MRVYGLVDELFLVRAALLYRLFFRALQTLLVALRLFFCKRLLVLDEISKVSLVLAQQQLI